MQHEGSIDALIAALTRALACGSDAALLGVLATLQSGVTALLARAPSAHARGATSVALEVDTRGVERELAQLGRVVVGKAPSAPQCTLQGAVPESVAPGETLQLTVEMRCGGGAVWLVCAETRAHIQNLFLMYTHTRTHN